ncbi:hypothetical protein LCGC14_0246070 [marine sediment metagenome]|uniref:Helicase ATP-binding domain-containing protein n=1 Tax=marine sediment metagenome TaxID=412755 RepID=A0A0F9WR48_9ZZZZ
MTPSELKTQWQIGVVAKFKTPQVNGHGTVVAGTGTGKTRIAIILIQGLNQKSPGKSTDVVVPSRNLKRDWEKTGGHIEQWGLKDVHVFVINTYKNLRRSPTLLVLDEIHNYSAPTYKLLFTNSSYSFLLGLTATIERLDHEHYFLLDKAPVFEKLSLEKARKMQFVSNYVAINYGIELSVEDQDKSSEWDAMVSSTFSKFSHNWALARACAGGYLVPAVVFFHKFEDINNLTEVSDGAKIAITKTSRDWRLWYATQMGWDGFTKEAYFSPHTLQREANIFTQATKARENFLHNHPLKLETIQEIRNLFPGKKMVVFSQRTDFADEVALKIPNSFSYHSKTCGEIRVPRSLPHSDIVVGRGIRVEIAGKKTPVIRYRDLNDGTVEQWPWFKQEYPGCKRIGAASYKEEMMDKFRANEITTLSTVVTLDEGFDVEGIEIAIIASGTGVGRQNIQRMGRAVRFVDGKTAFIFNLYFKDTQDEKWLNRRQFGNTNPVWMSSLNYDKLLDLITDERKNI